MRSFALIALLAATVYADGHLPTNSTMVDEHHDDHEEDEMNTAEQLMKAIDSITELFIEEADLIEDGKINPKALEGAKGFRELLEMICEVDHDEDDHDGHEDHDDGADHNRMLDGHEAAEAPEHHEDMDMAEERDARCMKAWRLLRSMEEYAYEGTTDERRDEITEMWSEGLDSAWAEMFEGASTIATSVAGLATAVAVLSF